MVISLKNFNTEMESKRIILNIFSFIKLVTEAHFTSFDRKILVVVTES